MLEGTEIYRLASCNWKSPLVVARIYIDKEWSSGGVEERRSGGLEEWRSRGVEEYLADNLLIPLIRHHSEILLGPVHHLSTTVHSTTYIPQ